MDISWLFGGLIGISPAWALYVASIEGLNVIKIKHG